MLIHQTYFSFDIIGYSVVLVQAVGQLLLNWQVLRFGESFQ